MKLVRLAALAAALLVTASSIASAPSPVRASDVTVSMQYVGFAPAQITVAAGDTIVWVNDDIGIPHDVVSGLPTREDEGQLFRSAELQEGESYTFTFAEPGTFDYFCSLHPFTMVAQVTVEGQASVPAARDQAAVTAQSGS